MEEFETVWIPVEDTQPEDCALCLVWDSSSRKQCVARFKFAEDGVNWEFVGNESLDPSRITHWRPVPGRKA